MIQGPGIHRREVVSAGTQRIYLLHLPRDFDPNGPCRLLMVLHGGGGSALFASRVHGWCDLSNRERCIVVFPEAECEDPARPADVRLNPRLWNDGSSRSAVARRNVDDIAYLSAVLDDVNRHCTVDPARVFVTGFSNGASMTFRVGVELADRVAALAPVAGHLCVQDPRPAQPRSLIYIIGLEDPLNPFAGGTTRTPWGKLRHRPPVMDSIHAWVRLIGASETTHLLSDSGDVRAVQFGPGPGGQLVQLYTVAGQGHEWPGAQRTLPRSISGPQTDKLNATQTIWEFFRKFEE